MTEQRGDGATRFGGMPGPLTRAMLYAVYAGVFLTVLFGPIYFGAWLSRDYVAVLDWPDTSGIGSGAVAIGLLVRYARLDRGWHGAVLASLGAGTIAALLFANMVAVAVIAWALDPAFVTDLGGWVVVFLISTILTAPAIIGANRLIEGRLDSDLSWKEWFKDTHFRKPTFLGFGLGLAGFFAAQLSANLLESWLVEVFPDAQSLHLGAVAPGIAIVLTCGLTGPSDRHSTLRSLLAALVVFEAAVAGTVTEAVLILTLRSDSLWLATAGIWLVAPVFLGAGLLVGRRENAAEGQAQDASADEELPV